MLIRDEPVLGVFVAAVAGYLLGAVPTGYIIVRLVRGADLRRAGSGHTGGLNAARQAGLVVGVITAAVDVALALGAVGLAGRLSESPWAVTAAGVMAVVGHNWSIFIRFGGGIGLTSLGGALLWEWPLEVVIAGGAAVFVWLALVRLLRVHRARATVIVLVLVVPALWALGVPADGVALAAGGGLGAIVKTIPDWRREYGQTADASSRQQGTGRGRLRAS